MRNTLILIAALLVIAGCSPDAPDAPRNPPTLTAPAAWNAVGAPITLDNAARLGYLGRLDPPDEVATWFDVALTPDATTLAAINVAQIAAWDLRTGENLFYTARGDVNRLFIAPTQTELYGVTSTGTVNIYNARTGAQIGSFVGAQAFTGVVAWDAARGRIAFGNTEGVITVWDAATRRPLAGFDGHDGQIFALAFAPDGERLASTALDHVTALWDWRNAERIDAVEASDVLRLDFMPDGTGLAAGIGSAVQLWTFGAEPVTLQTGGSDVLLFSRDGRYLLAGGRSVGLTLWNAATQTYIGGLPDTSGENVSAAFSPEGSLLLTATLNQAVYLWNLTTITGTTLSQALLDTGTRQIHRIQWSDDGRLLLLFDAVGAIYLWGISS